MDVNGFVATVVQNWSKLTAIVTIEFYVVVLYTEVVIKALYVSYYERQNSNKQEKLTPSAELFQNSETFRYSSIRLLNNIYFPICQYGS